MNVNYNYKNGCSSILMYMLFWFGFIIAYSVIMAFVCLLMWNYLMPTLFNLPEMNFWQMLCLMFLIRIILMPININYNNKQN